MSREIDIRKKQLQMEELSLITCKYPNSQAEGLMQRTKSVQVGQTMLISDWSFAGIMIHDWSFRKMLTGDWSFGTMLIRDWSFGTMLIGDWSFRTEAQIITAQPGCTH